MKKNQSAREVALELLIRIEKDKSFSHLIISKTLQDNNLSEKDANLLTEIVYGTLERKITLAYYLKPYMKTKKTPVPWVVTLLQMSVFQMEFLDKIPTYAIINEAVEIAKRKGHKGIAAFVNGVLRNFARQGPPDTSLIKDPIERLAIETSHPQWLIARWVELYGFETTKKMSEHNVTKKAMAIRVNQLKATRQEMLEQLEEMGIKAIASPYVPDGIIIHSGNILKTDLIEKGYATIQDQSSMFATLALQLESEMKVLDTCSAPGGKATYIGELMQNKGEVYAHDLHQNKISLIENNALRLDLTNIKTTQKDARKLREIYPAGYFDRILVDAHCSGLGVVRTKPDIKYNKRIEDSERLQQIQLDILHHIAPLLKNNGKIVYSTCTVDTTENEEVIRLFLESNSNYQVDKQFLRETKSILSGAHISEYGVQLFPHTMNGDGFFVSRLIKVIQRDK